MISTQKREKRHRTVDIGEKKVSGGQSCFIIAEIGINHNGDMSITRKLIDEAAKAGCDAVKFQKRTVDVVYSPEELVQIRETPFGNTNGDLKRALEFGIDAYHQIDAYCKEKEIQWFASCWDEGAVDFIEQFNPPCHKIASASLTDDGLLRHYKATGRPIFLSTGMSTIEEIRHAVNILGTENLILMHCTSTYPAIPEELNLSAITKMSEAFDCPVGYSGHEVGLQTTLAAVVLGAVAIERHITLDRAMWGSDQAASVEPQGFSRLVRDIRTTEIAMGDGIKRVYESEIPVRAKLRRV